MEMQEDERIFLLLFNGSLHINLLMLLIRLNDSLFHSMIKNLLQPVERL